MNADTELLSFLSTQHRALRLRLAYPEGAADEALLPQRITGLETICGGIEYRVLCVAASAQLALKSMIALPAELQFVTDRGQLHRVCGIVTEASAGQSDGGLATYQLVIRDGLAVLDLRRNTRIFLDKNELDIIAVLLDEWRQRSPQLGLAFEYRFAPELTQHNFPKREFTMQYDESDAAFLRRLLKRRGIAWHIQAGPAQAGKTDGDGDEDDSPTPVHTLLMFDDQNQLPENAAGSVRYHRADATEERDTITAWGAVRTLQAGSVSGFSWDYSDPHASDFMTGHARSAHDQGIVGTQLAASLNDYRMETPHIGDDHQDHVILGHARMDRHDYDAKYFHGEGTVRNLRVGQSIALVGHPEIDLHPEAERRFVLTSLRISARNNLPKQINARLNRLFARSHWEHDGVQQGEGPGAAVPPFRCAFTCVRQGVKIVPAFDPRHDVPRARMQSAIVVGPAGEEVHCDALSRIRVHFPAVRAADHEHADGAGASRTEADSAWIRFVSPWAGNGTGAMSQCGAVFLPRAGSEVCVAFMDDDPDKPVIVGQLYNYPAPPPALSSRGALPGNRFLSGLRSREIRGSRGNQLRFDDTPGQISAQLASDHGRSELNLGWCSEPRADGAGAPRGEGAELRSDEYIALRAAKGLLLSAWTRVAGSGGASGKQLARDEYLALMRDCSALFGSLGKYAAEHQALAQDAEAQDALQAAFQRWDNGSNTAPKGADGGAPIIGVTAPAGISFATSKAIVSYAASNIDTVAQQHLQLTAGQRFNLNAGKGISLFSHHDGIAAIAHRGKLLMQSQHDATEINAATNLKLTATEGKLTGMAKVIELIAEDGSFIKIGGGSITLGSNAPLKFHAPDFMFDGAITMATALPLFEGQGTSKQFLAVYDDGIAVDPETGQTSSAPGSLAQDVDLSMALSDGSRQQGRSDIEGKSALLQRDAMHLAEIIISSEGPAT